MSTFTYLRQLVIDAVSETAAKEAHYYFD